MPPVFRSRPRRPHATHPSPPATTSPVLPYRDPEADRAEDAGPSNREVLVQAIVQLLACVVLTVLLVVATWYVQGCLAS